MSQTRVRTCVQHRCAVTPTNGAVTASEEPLLHYLATTVLHRYADRTLKIHNMQVVHTITATPPAMHLVPPDKYTLHMTEDHIYDPYT